MNESDVLVLLICAATQCRRQSKPHILNPDACCQVLLSHCLDGQKPIPPFEVGKASLPSLTGVGVKLYYANKPSELPHNLLFESPKTPEPYKA